MTGKCRARKAGWDAVQEGDRVSLFVLHGFNVESERGADGGDVFAIHSLHNGRLPSIVQTSVESARNLVNGNCVAQGWRGSGKKTCWDRNGVNPVAETGDVGVGGEGRDDGLGKGRGSRKGRGLED